ncbi:transposase family protein A [Striga asiatica]|uniref:Transposase family protein A n=1 Tax=Striga asiatica TaxID=4170 RepID=A0A5A7PCX4_STRAF|nr:transposase family protein A [Striga asiatica]
MKRYFHNWRCQIDEQVWQSRCYTQQEHKTTFTYGVSKSQVKAIANLLEEKGDDNEIRILLLQNLGENVSQLSNFTPSHIKFYETGHLNHFDVSVTHSLEGQEEEDE